MANQALINAVNEANPKFSPAGEAFSRAFEYRINQYTQAAKESSEKWDEIVSSAKKPKIDALGNTPEMTKSMYNFYSEGKNKFYSEAKNLSPYDPKLKELVLNYSQSVTDGEVAAATHQQFFKYLSEAKLSSVNDKETADLADRYMKLGIGMDENGQIAYKDANGIVPIQELASIQDKIIEVPDVIYRKLTTTADSLLSSKAPFGAIEQRLKYMIGDYMSDKAYGEDFIFDSLGGEVTPYDLSADEPAGNFRLGKYRGMTKNEILAEAGKQVGKDPEAQMDFLKNEVLNGYMTAFKGVHAMANPPKKEEATQAEINRTEKNKTKEAIINDTMSVFSDAVAKKDLNFLLGRKSISYGNKKIKSIESNPDGTVNLVYDINATTEGAFNNVKLSAQIVEDLLSSYAENKYDNFDDNARLELSKKIRETYKGGVLTAPDPYAGFIRR